MTKQDVAALRVRLEEALGLANVLDLPLTAVRVLEALDALKFENSPERHGEIK